MILHYLTLQKILPKHTCIETIIQRTIKPRFSPTQNIRSRWTWQKQFIGNLRWLLYSNANCLISSSLPLLQGVHSTVNTPHPNHYSVSNHSITRVMKSTPKNIYTMLTHPIIFFYHDGWTFKQEAEIKKYEDSLTIQYNTNYVLFNNYLG